jgi:hypothetical protein
VAFTIFAIIRNKLLPLAISVILYSKLDGLKVNVLELVVFDNVNFV